MTTDQSKNISKTCSVGATIASFDDDINAGDAEEREADEEIICGDCVDERLLLIIVVVDGIETLENGGRF